MLLLEDIAPAGLEDAHVFPDHLDPGLLHYLPPGLEVAHDALGHPEFVLVRFAGDDESASGGRLRLTLRYADLPESIWQAASEAGWTLRRTAFEQGRLRLRLRSLLEGEDGEAGQWQPAAFARRGPSATEVSLSPSETQILQTLLEDGRGVVEFDWELDYQGLSRPRPWLVIVESIELIRQLKALLSGQPLRADQVEAAFLSLPQGLVEWVPLGKAAAAAAPRQAILRETARRCLPLLFNREPGEGERYRLDETAQVSEKLRFDLLRPRREMRRHRLQWSVADFWSRLDEQQRAGLFPEVRPPAPFQRATVWVVNHLPIDPSHLREVQVDLQHTGPRGAPRFRSFTFDGSGDAESFSTGFVALAGSFSLSFRLSLVIAQGDGPPELIETGFEEAPSTLVEINRDAAGVDFLQVDSEEDLFAKVGRVEVSIESAPDDSEGAAQELARSRLTAGKTSAWPVLKGVEPSAPLRVQCLAYQTAEEEAGQGIVLFDQLVEGRLVSLPAYLAEVLEPERVRISTSQGFFANLAFAVLELAPSGASEEAADLFRLDPGQVRVWRFYRDSIFQPVSFRYRLRFVARNQDGETLPLAETDWIQAHGNELLLNTPVPVEEEAPA
ncbi:MAG: hypothetical protein V3T83_04500 [Acidobacteriota bacterium]